MPDTHNQPLTLAHSPKFQDLWTTSAYFLLLSSQQLLGRSCPKKRDTVDLARATCRTPNTQSDGISWNRKDRQILSRSQQHQDLFHCLRQGPVGREKLLFATGSSCETASEASKATRKCSKMLENYSSQKRKLMPTATHGQLELSHHSFDGSENQFAGIQHHLLLDPEQIWRSCVPSELLRWFGSMFHNLATYRPNILSYHIVSYKCIYTSILWLGYCYWIYFFEFHFWGFLVVPNFHALSSIWGLSLFHFVWHVRHFGGGTFHFACYAQHFRARSGLVYWLWLVVC